MEGRRVVRFRWLWFPLIVSLPSASQCQSPNKSSTIGIGSSYCLSGMVIHSIDHYKILQVDTSPYVCWLKWAACESGFEHGWLVGGIPTPLKIWKSVGIIIPKIWKNKNCSIPPTRTQSNSINSYHDWECFTQDINPPTYQPNLRP